MKRGSLISCGTVGTGVYSWQSVIALVNSPAVLYNFHGVDVDIETTSLNVFKGVQCSNLIT